MTHSLQTVRIWSCLVVASVMLTCVAQSAQFTAVASGNWSAVATWGAAAPSVNITNNQIIIPAGITVAMESDITINGASASMGILGTLTSAANGTLTVTQGSLAGNGTINIGTLVMNAGATLMFTGEITVEYLTNASTVIQARAPLIVNKALNLTGGILTMATGGSLSLANDATITRSGGTLAVNGGALALTNAYHVRYITSAATTGLELSGAGLTNVIVDVPTGTSISLGANITINPLGALNLTSGTLRLNGRDLIVNGALTADVGTSINSTSASSIEINSIAGTAGSLNFNGAGNAVLNFTVGVGANNSALIAGTLNITGALQLMSGALRFDGANLTLNGTVSGPGQLSADASSNLIINTAGGIGAGIRFATGGQNVNNLTVNVGANNSVGLVSNLTVHGLTSLTGGSNLNISTVTLTINGDVNGTGSFLITGNSGLTVNTANGLTSNLSFSGNTIGILTINTDSGKTVGLGSDLIVWQTLVLQGGTLVLNGNDLTINDEVISQASGFLRSTSASDISIVSPTGTTGSLNFSGTANAVKNLTVNVGGVNTTSINGMLSVENSLNLQSGTLNIGGSTLTLNGGVTGAGALGTDENSNLIINTPGGIPAGLNIKDAGGQVIREAKNITINVGAGNTVKLLSDLSILGTTTLTSGGLDISNFDLSIGGQLIGTGTIVVNGNSGVMINTLGGLTAPISFSGSSIGDFGVNVGTGGSVRLGSDLIVAKTLTLNGGTLILNGHDLSIGGNIVGGITGLVRSTEESDISIASSTSTTGILRFSDSSAVGTLTIDVGTTNSARIGGNVDVMNALELTSGILVFHGADLTLTGILTGSGMLSGNATSNLTINAPGGMATGLRFASNGKTLNNLSVDVGAANSVDLASDLIVNGTTNLGTGTLDISGFDLTLGGALTGTGSIAVNGNSGLIVNTPGGISTPLALSGTTLGDLTVNVGDSGSVSLGGDLNLSRMLYLRKGTLILNGNDLTISGIVDGNGSGAISSTNASDITIATALSSTGKVMFDLVSNTVNDLTIATINGGVASIGTDAMVDGNLTLTTGRLNIGGNTLTIGTDGSIIGGNSTSFIQTSAGGAVSMNLDAGASVATIFPVGTATSFFPASVTLHPSSASGNVNVGVYEGVFAQGTTGSLISATESTVNATWDVSSDITSNLKLNLELAWGAQAEVNGFNRAQSYISHYMSNAWDADAMASATARGDGMFSLTRNNIESLSPFAIFDATTSDVTEDDLANNYKVYPSPATDVLVIDNLASAGTPTKVDIVDAQGRIVASFVMNGAHHSITVGALGSGVYFIKLYNAQAVTTKSFVKL